MSEVIVEKLPIGFLVGIFVFYIISHTVIVLIYKYMIKHKEEHKEGSEFGDKEIKIMKFLSSWYHLIYVVVAIFLMYAR